MIVGFALLALAAPATAGSASPQLTAKAATPQLTLFPDRFYRGTPQRFAAQTSRLPAPVAPQSVTAQGRWEVCSDADFEGRCVEIDRDYPVAAGLGNGFAVRSLRPLAAGEGAGRPAAAVVPGGASVTGVASRYWPAPTYGAERVLACPNGKSNLDCAHDTAEDLCRRAGYRTVRYWQLQTVAARVYLADILCTRSDEK